MPILLTSLNQYPTLLAHSANLLEGLYVLLMFFLYFFYFLMLDFLDPVAQKLMDNLHQNFGIGRWV